MTTTKLRRLGPRSPPRKACAHEPGSGHTRVQGWVASSFLLPPQPCHALPGAQPCVWLLPTHATAHQHCNAQRPLVRTVAACPAEQRRWAHLPTKGPGRLSPVAVGGSLLGWPGRATVPPKQQQRSSGVTARRVNCSGEVAVYVVAPWRRCALLWMAGAGGGLQSEPCVRGLFYGEYFILAPQEELLSLSCVPPAMVWK